MTHEQFRECLPEAREVVYKLLVRVRPGSRDWAEDLAQQVMLELLKRDPANFVSPACVRGYARAAGYNRDNDRWRKENRLNRVEGDQGNAVLSSEQCREESPLIAAQRQDIQRTIWRAVERLHPGERDVIVCWLNGAETDREAAEMMSGTTEPATDGQRQSAARMRRAAFEVLRGELASIRDEFSRA